MTRLYDKRMVNIEECENIKNIETRLRMTQSETSSTRSKKHGPKVNSDPDPSSSNSSDLSSSESAPKRNKSKKKKNYHKHQKDESSDTYSSDDSDSSEDSHYRRKRRKDKKNRKEDPIRLCATLTAKLLMTAFK